ncbi:MAG: CopG family transcriptional regulator [Thermoprotei archaeon]|nr:MAG: CopG family transcriptional regulator [Thermoprotei archaeon]
MSAVVTFRIPKRLKKKMDMLRDVVNWSEELRKFVEQRVKELEQERAIIQLEEIIQKIPKTPKGSTVKYVREDRDSH